MIELEGEVVEGPLEELDALHGGVKLVAFAGSIATLFEHEIHPSMLNLQPGQTIRYRYTTSDLPPLVSLAQEK